MALWFLHERLRGELGQQKNSEDSVVDARLRRLPLLRAYRVLQDVRRELGEARKNKVSVQISSALTHWPHSESWRSGRSAPGNSRFSRSRLSTTISWRQIACDRSSIDRNAERFPDLIEDGSFNAAILDRVAGEIEAMDRGGWHHWRATHERKWSTEDRARWSIYPALIAQLNAGPFVSILEEFTCIGGLVPDPSLRGGGLDEIRHGGLLGVHADFNVHPRAPALSAIEPSRLSQQGLAIGMGRRAGNMGSRGSTVVRAIQPVFNRAVPSTRRISATTDILIRLRVRPSDRANRWRSITTRSSRPANQIAPHTARFFSTPIQRSLAPSRARADDRLTIRFTSDYHAEASPRVTRT